MTLKEAYKKVLQKVSAKEGDLKTEQYIKDSVNYAYQIICTKIEKKTKNTTILKTNTVNSVPSDFQSFVIMLDGSREVNKLEFDIVGDLIILKSSDITSDPVLYYVSNATKLTNDTDILEVSEASSYAVVIYAAYAYYVQVGNLNSASLLLGEFNNYLKSNGVDVEVVLNDPKATT